MCPDSNHTQNILESENTIQCETSSCYSGTPTRSTQHAVNPEYPESARHHKREKYIQTHTRNTQSCRSDFRSEGCQTSSVFGLARRSKGCLTRTRKYMPCVALSLGSLLIPHSAFFPLNFHRTGTWLCVAWPRLQTPLSPSRRKNPRLRDSQPARLRHRRHGYLKSTFIL